MSPTPSLSFLMRARNAGIRVSDMTPEELAAAEEAIAARQRFVGPRGQAPAGQTVSPDVFSQIDLDANLIERSDRGGAVFTNDPNAVRGSSPSYSVPAVRQSLVDLHRMVGAPPPTFSEDGGVVRGMDGYPIDLTDPASGKLVADYARKMMDYKPPAPDVVEGLALKAQDVDLGASDYFQLPPTVAETYGISGVNLGALSIGEKLTLRRMGVQLPAPPRRKRRR